jgi:hypothetical protein
MGSIVCLKNRLIYNLSEIEVKVRLDVFRHQAGDNYLASDLGEAAKDRRRTSLSRPPSSQSLRDAGLMGTVTRRWKSIGIDITCSMRLYYQMKV